MQNNDDENENLEIIKKTLEENELARVDFLMKPLNVVFYGMGKEGIETLDLYNHAFKNKKTAWKLVALIDGKVRKITVADKDYGVYAPDIIRSVNPDIILITSSVYYWEIEKNLVKIGFDKRIIKDPAALYYT